VAPCRKIAARRTGGEDECPGHGLSGIAANLWGESSSIRTINRSTRRVQDHPNSPATPGFGVRVDWCSSDDSSRRDYDTALNRGHYVEDLLESPLTTANMSLGVEPGSRSQT
jgi:hypothetical protein